MKKHKFNFILALSVVIVAMLNISNSFGQESDTIKTQKEDEFYILKTIPIPQNVELEVGGMVLLPNDVLAVSTRKGDVWMITNPYMRNGQSPLYKLFAQGMHEVLGINYINNDIYVMQRSELTRLRDLNGDGIADEYYTMATWPLAGNYHEYAYGPVLAKDGSMLVTLNLGWIGYGESLSKWDGWMLKIWPDGRVEPFATGLRSPAGFALNDEGDIFYSENQGDWVGSGNITHIEKSDFLGNPAGLIWADQPDSPVKLRKKDIPDTGEPKFEVAKRVPGLKTPSVWFPHSILGVSTSGMLNYDSQGSMGPFKGQLFVGDQGQSKIMRVNLEKVNGVYQGAVFPFREGFSSGILRMNWGSDKSMFVGMTSRGWGSTGDKLFGLQQLSWNGKIPFEIHSIVAQPDGFKINFTKEVSEAEAKLASSYNVTSFTYKYHSKYGSPVINQAKREIKALEISEDKMSVRIVVDSLINGYIYEIKAVDVKSTDNYALLHNFGYYTLNSVPSGAKLAITDRNRVGLADVHAHNHPMPKVAKKAHAIAATQSSVSKTEITKVTKRQTKMPADWTNGPDKTIVITPKPGLKFSIDNISIKAGTKIKLTFKNTDDMLHNMVFTNPGKASVVGELALKLGLNAEQLNYVPNTKDVIFYTALLQPNQSDTIYFTAPAKAGDYDFVCTYSGHYLIMRGIMKVIDK